MTEARSSPCLWGCFFVASVFVFNNLVFPMLVGVFLFSCLSILLAMGLPHACGGVSKNDCFNHGRS